MNNTVLDKPLPTSPATEKALLAAIIINGSVDPGVMTLVEPSDMSDVRHKKIYKAIRSLAERGEEIDLLTIKNELGPSGVEDAGGPAYVSGIVDSIPDVSHVQRYAAIIKDLSTRRALAKTGFTLIEHALNDEHPTSKILAAASGVLLDLQMGSDAASIVPTTLDKVVGGLIEEIDRRRAEGDFLTGITTGLYDLDAYLLGWQPGVLTLIAAYTSVGKTTAGLDFAKKALEAPGNEGIHVFYAALEMTKEMLGYRMLANASNEKLHWVRTGNLTDKGIAKVIEGHRKIAGFGSRFHITDGAFTIDQITAAARALKQQGKLDLMFVDYLQLVEGGDGDNREREVNNVGWKLLQLAKTLRVPVIAFAQLNDGIVNREGHEPKLSDMRESRAINQHSRTVLMLNRPWVFDKPADDPVIKPCLTHIYIEKNSESKTGRIQLHFNAAYQRFEAGGCHDGCEYYRGESEGGQTRQWQ